MKKPRSRIKKGLLPASTNFRAALQLRRLIKELAPERGYGTHADAYAKIQLAIERYRQSFHSRTVDGVERRMRDSISEIRASLRTLVNHLSAAEESLAALPPGAVRYFSTAPMLSPVPPLAAVRTLARDIASTKAALARADAAPDAPKDMAARLLAWEVALAMKNLLKVLPRRVSGSADSYNATPNDFERLLRAAFAVAGIRTTSFRGLIGEVLDELEEVTKQ